ncbi:MAG: hypothetical protein IT193_11320 [Propionibacteriaceae bacterium]|nr:hypothetical protein [Propionibacteriaceae bacterium]
MAMLRISAAFALAPLLTGCGVLDRLSYARSTTAAPSPSAVSTCAGFRLVATGTQAVTSEVQDEVRGLVEQRLRATGLEPIEVSAKGSDGIIVRWPADADVTRVLGLIGTPGRLEFIPVPLEFVTSVYVGSPLPTGMDAKPIFPADRITSATESTDLRGAPAVDLTLDATAARLLDLWAADHYGDAFVIALDGSVLSLLSLNATELSSEAQVVGRLAREDVVDLVAILNAGPLPTGLEEDGGIPCE